MNILERSELTGSRALEIIEEEIQDICELRKQRGALPAILSDAAVLDLVEFVRELTPESAHEMLATPTMKTSRKRLLAGSLIGAIDAAAILGKTERWVLDHSGYANKELPIIPCVRLGKEQRHAYDRAEIEKVAKGLV